MGFTTTPTTTTTTTKGTTTTTTTTTIGDGTRDAMFCFQAKSNITMTQRRNMPSLQNVDFTK